MPLQDLLDQLLAAVAIDSGGAKIGAVRQVYVDDSTGKATFATVSTGIFSADAVVPLYGARLLDGELHLGHTRQEVRSAPRPDDSEDGLRPAQEVELLEHFGIEGAEDDDPTASGRAKDAAAASATPSSTPATPTD